MVIEVQPAVRVKVTVLFEDPFWVGVVERTDERGYQVARAVFGSEPTPAELCDYMLANYSRLDFSAPLMTGAPAFKRPNYKRRLREARRTTAERGLSTKAQEAMRREIESRQVRRRQVTREEREAELARKRELKQTQKKEKHRGH